MRARWLALAFALALAGCKRGVDPTAPTPPAAPLASASSSSDHVHPTSFPPVGPAVKVTLDGKSREVAIDSVKPLAGSSPAAVSVLDVVHAAWPGVDLANVRFDFVGSDGFHPSSRPKCTRSQTGAELGPARLEVVTHNLTLDDAVDIPKCYYVKAVVAIELSR